VAISATTLAALLYYLSRSESENVANLLPFILLLVIRASWLYRDRLSWRVGSAFSFGLVLSSLVAPHWPFTREFRLNYDIASLYAAERKAEAELLAGMDMTRFGVVSILNIIPPLTPYPRWGFIDSAGAWSTGLAFNVPLNRQQLYVRRTSTKLPDQRPSGCLIVEKEYAFFRQVYEPVFDVISQHARGDYLMYGMIRKGAALPSSADPCSPKSPALLELTKS
jgi:hypothetical protein